MGRVGARSAATEVFRGFGRSRLLAVRRASCAAFASPRIWRTFAARCGTNARRCRVCTASLIHEANWPMSACRRPCGSGSSLIFKAAARFAKSKPSRRTPARSCGKSPAMSWPHSLRELELIRRHQPRFNVKGRQPIRPLGFIYLSREDAPRFRIARRVPRGVRYSWGPMPMNWRIRDAVEIVNWLFKLCDCGPSVRCTLPISGSCSRWICACNACAAKPVRASAHARANARSRNMRPNCERPARCSMAAISAALERLEADLADAAASQQYERAVRLRDTLERLQYLCDQLAILRAPPLPEQVRLPVAIG